MDEITSQAIAYRFPKPAELMPKKTIKVIGKKINRNSGELKSIHCHLSSQSCYQVLQ
jgi:hypothetical protein